MQTKRYRPMLLRAGRQRSFQKRKAEAVAKLCPDDVVLGSDTLVCCEGNILGKPKNEEDAARMLRLLSGKTHQVYTGVTVVGKESVKTWVTASDVTFLELSAEEINDYLKTGEPKDKAGAYAVQGEEVHLFRLYQVIFFAIMGLPASGTVRILKEFDITPNLV